MNMSNRKNILVLAYSISPYRGSECSVAWNYVTEMSKEHCLTVMYGCGGMHMGDNDDMSKWLKSNRLNNVDFIFVKPTPLSMALNWTNRNGYFMYPYFLAYKLWHKKAYQTAIQLLNNQHFDLIHYLGPIGYREQGYLWKLNIPYMRGPMGGFDFAPAKMLADLPFTAQLKQYFRNVTSKLTLKYNSTIRRALKRADLLIAATTESQQKIQKYYGIKAVYMPENCIIGQINLNRQKFQNPSKYRIFMVGTLDWRKCQIIILHTLLKCKFKDKFHIDLVGDGPARKRFEEFTSDNRIESYVTFHGNLDRAEVVKLFHRAHLNVITSISEANTTVLWEAMACGVPTMTIDHCGMHDIINDNCGIRIPVSSIDGISDMMAKQLDNMAEHPQLFESLANGALNRCQEFLWDKRREIFNELYDRAISNYNNKQQ